MQTNTPNGGRRPHFDPAEIRKFIAAVVPEGGVFECRVLNGATPSYARRRDMFGYFDSADALIKALPMLTDFAGVYITLNGLPGEMLGRAKNRLRDSEKGQSTSDAHIRRRIFFYVDVDSVRTVSGIAASESELQTAIAKREEVAAWLESQGWPAPIKTMSGNGGALLYRVDEPNDQATTELVSRCIHALANRFSSPEVTIDLSVFNAARITRLCGSLNRKGDELPDRPHRMARVDHLPEILGVVTREQLEALAALAPATVTAPTGRTAGKSAGATVGGERRIDRFIAKHGEKFPALGTWEPYNGGRKMVLPICPFNAEHNDKSAVLTESAAGVLGFKCHHNGCAGNNWQALRAKFEPDRPVVSISENGIDARCTDTANAARFADQHGDNLKFVRNSDWMAWDAIRWQQKADPLPAMIATAKSIYAEAAEAENNAEREALAKWAKKSLDANRLNAAISIAKSMLAVDPQKLDAEPKLINCLNGVLNLETLELTPHDAPGVRDLYCTKMANARFDPSARTPVFTAFMNRIFQNDRELILYVTTYLGYCLTGDIRHQLFPIFYGTGANGKSVLIEAVKHCMGDYAGDAPESLLMQGKNEHATELADLQSRRLVVLSETESGARLKLQLMKRLTGDATVKARHMRQDFYEFRRTHKFIMLTNHKPVIRGNGEDIFRRVRLIPFNVTIPPSERDTKLSEKLAAEADGIFTALAIAAQWALRDGLTDEHTPSAVRNATADYREESDTLGNFMADCCIVEDDKVAGISAVFQAYTQWCELQNERPMSRRVFADEMQRRGFKQGQKWGIGRTWQGIGLAAADVPV